MGVVGLSVRRATVEDVPLIMDALVDFSQRVGKSVDGVMALVCAAFANPAESVFIALHDGAVGGILLCSVLRENLQDLVIGIPLAWISAKAPKGTWEEGLRVAEEWGVTLGARALTLEVPFTRGIAAYQRAHLDKNSFRPVSVIFRRPVGVADVRHADTNGE